MSNLINNLSVLTTIKVADLEELSNKIFLCISDDIYQSFIVNKENSCQIETTLGVLNFYYDEQRNIKIKFTPSNKLVSTVTNTLVNKENLLETTITDNLVNKITNTFKDYL